MKAWLSLLPVSAAGVDVENSHPNRLGSKFAKTKNASVLREKMAPMEAGQFRAVRAKGAPRRSRLVRAGSSVPLSRNKYMTQSDFGPHQYWDNGKERRRVGKGLVRPSRRTSWAQFMASRGTNCEESRSEWADLGSAEKQGFVEIARFRRVTGMLSSAPSLADQPTAARYEATWGRNDVQFPAPIGYLQELGRLQAAGTEPQQTIRTC